MQPRVANHKTVEKKWKTQMHEYFILQQIKSAVRNGSQLLRLFSLKKFLIIYSQNYNTLSSQSSPTANVRAPGG